ncbi:MAG: phage head closure protein [Aeromonas sp.]
MVACKCSSFASEASTRVILQSLSTVDDGYGGRTETWTDAMALWAKVEPGSGREVYLNSQLQSRVDAKVTIRWRSELVDTNLAAKYRLKVGARLYNVQAVRNLESSMKLEGKAFQMLLCTEGEPS